MGIVSGDAKRENGRPLKHTKGNVEDLSILYIPSFPVKKMYLF
jgi:hypothetical protein